MPPPVTERDGPKPYEVVAQRSEFVRAFVEHAGPRPASERLTVRLPTLITVAGLSAVAAIVVGVFINLIHLESGSSAEAKVTYTAVTGWDCASADDHGFEATGRTPAWASTRSGGWASDGCHGSFATIPVSGRSDSEDPKQYATWQFSPGAAHRCEISVYVPNLDGADSAIRLSSSASYTVMSGEGSVDGNFTVDQRSNPGTWIRGGSVTTKDAKLSVRLSNRGAPQTDRVAITQVKVACSG